MKTLKKIVTGFGAASIALLALGFVTAQAATTTTESKPAGSKLAASYSSFAGSPANAQALVDGLRSGTPVTLDSPATGPTAGAPAASLSPATGKLGFGEINTALSLAKTSLAQQGITNPTPAQISTSLSGILDQRAAGIGWGKIANTMGVKLGAIVSASKTSKAGKKSSTHTKSTHVAKADNEAGDGKGHGKGGNGGNGGNGGSGGGKK